ncbi:MAG: translocase [Rhodobacteraceae bacterium]|nr:translocase [Paracoccaceae bacterium]
MPRKQPLIMAGATLTVALSIGYVMQFGLGAPSAAKANIAQELPLEQQVTDITVTSSTALRGFDALSGLPVDIDADTHLPEAPVVLAAAKDIPVSDTILPVETASSGFDCEVSMTATAIAGAMVELDISAPCLGTEPFIMHHNGLMFSDILQPDGELSLQIPALSQQAVFIIAFNNGEGAVAQTNVASLPFYERVALQWKGDSGVQLHAHEFGASYFSAGHVWQAAAGDLRQAARGESGFLRALGSERGADTLHAEIYSYPAATSGKAGIVGLSVEVEVTQENCGREIEAQTLELRHSAEMRVRDLSLTMPSCDAVGEFLVLKNLIEDLTIASK